MKKQNIFSRLAVSCLCILLLFPGILPPQPPLPPEDPGITEGEPPIQPLSDDDPIELLD